MRPAHAAQAAFLLVAASCIRECTPEPCAQVRILLGALLGGLKSNAQANHILWALCHLTWANARHDPLSPAARAAGRSENRGMHDASDVSAPAGNGRQDRVLVRAPHGKSRPARQSGTASSAERS
jgi:hypothetical protein